MTEEPPSYPPPQPAVGTNRMAIASLVCSLFGWLCAIGPILGLIFGFIALGQIKQTGQRGRGMAIAGIVIGVIGFVLGVVAISARMSHMYSGAPAVVITVAPQPVSPMA